MSFSRRALVSGALLALIVVPVAAGSAATPKPAESVSVIVREGPRAGTGPEQMVQRLGGRVGRRIPIINGFVATVPRSGVSALGRTRGVQSVTINRRLRLHGLLNGWDQAKDPGSLFVARDITNADDMLEAGITGKGVDVALIDTGVMPVHGLAQPGRVIAGADLSFESQSPNLRYLDTYGHGTHLAGIIAGRDTSGPVAHDAKHFAGVAPEARILSLKVADAHGVTDVSQVLAAIDWVVEHRQDHGLNIRVLNLAFGTDGAQDYRLDPLAFAVEVAWRKGIAVVVAAGNGGAAAGRLNNPAHDPFVIAVGAVDGNGTSTTADDVVPSWSSSGDGVRNPDLVAPGKSLVSLRVPGSHIDRTFGATARVGKTRFFRGSGTSQAAAFVSGLAALIIQQRPTIKPDELKALLKSTASPIPNVSARLQGAGVANMTRIARRIPTPVGTQNFARGTGMGSLEAARGTQHLVAANGIELRGERDIFGTYLTGSLWAPLSQLGNAWNGGTWMGNAWTGNAWTGNAWTGNAWAGNAWAGNAWTANAWYGNAWSANAWSANAWNGNAWAGNAWAGNAWEGNAWSGNAWPGNAWSTQAWGG